MPEFAFADEGSLFNQIREVAGRSRRSERHTNISNLAQSAAGIPICTLGAFGTAEARSVEPSARR